MSMSKNLLAGPETYRAICTWVRKQVLLNSFTGDTARWLCLEYFLPIRTSIAKPLLYSPTLEHFEECSYSSDQTWQTLLSNPLHFFHISLVTLTNMIFRLMLLIINHSWESKILRGAVVDGHNCKKRRYPNVVEITPGYPSKMSRNQLTCYLK